MESELVELMRFYDSGNAFVARSVLESHGIQAFIFDEHTTATAWFWQFATGGIRLVVQKSDYDTAKEILSDFHKNQSSDVPQKKIDNPFKAAFWTGLFFLTGIFPRPRKTHYKAKDND